MDASHAPALDPSLGVQLNCAFADARVKYFIADAKHLADEPGLAIRNTAVYLRTENTLTGRFIPPAAGDVGTTLATALKLFDVELESRRKSAGKTALCALLASQILLTIHPFRDCNGRTSRLFFAAKVLRHLGPAPTAILGMLLMQRAGAHQYHQAAWALRAGDAEPMATLFAGSEELACELFHESAVNLPSAKLLEHCWTTLQELS